MARATPFPTSTYNNNNYWVDVLFQPAADAPPGVPTNVTATPGYQDATVTWTDPGQGGSPITSYTITPYIGATAQTPTTISGASVTQRDDRRADERHRIHVHGRRDQRQRHRARVRAVERRHARAASRKACGRR